jgi:uroporphyrin-III C-methyltransferase
MAETGTVYLVGAGPGDPELLTLKALRLIKAADVVVYDRLISSEIIAFIPKETILVDVGKRPGSHPVPQVAINRILIKQARAGNMVVRLKGGDPMIFGRGGEEARALAENNIKVETVPGITAAQGCAASLNLPLTQRGIAGSVLYLTGHTRHDMPPDLDWSLLARQKTTLVVYMGVAMISAIVQRLMDNGFEGETPALAICNGTRPDQRHLLTTISSLANDMKSANFNGPVLFFIGDAAAEICQNGALDYAGIVETAIAASV